MEQIKHICLDKDGVIIDVHHYWSHVIQKRAEKMLKTYGIPKVHLTKLCCSMGVDVHRKRILPKGPVGYRPRSVVIQGAIKGLSNLKIRLRADDLADLFTSVDREMEDDNFATHIRVLPNVRNVLKKMRKAQFKISIYSSDYVANLIRIINVLGLASYLDVLVGGDEVKNPKPHPEGFQLACGRAEIPLRSSIYVGDTVDDVRMALNCDSGGACAVTTGLCPRELLETHTANVFNDLGEIFTYLTRQNQHVQRDR